METEAIVPSSSASFNSNRHYGTTRLRYELLQSPEPNTVGVRESESQFFVG